MNKIVALDGHEVKAIADMFVDAEDTLVFSCLDGQMGQAWADNKEEPTCAMIIVGDFVFYGGDYESESARELVSSVPERYKGECLYAIPDSHGWAELIQEVYGERCNKFQRYGIEKNTEFVPDLLKSYVAKLPSEYTIKRFDKALYHESLEHGWSQDFVSNFLSAEDFLERGIGFSIIHEGKLVCGASSYTMYNEGIEIEIGTLKEYRRRGLALVCASALILECLEEGKYPSWDAANMGSVKLAEKLGYKYKGVYDTYELKI